MNISQKELEKLSDMLSAYKRDHGTITTGNGASLNCGCGSTCSSSCSSYCDGSRCFCWQTWKGGG